MQHISLVQTSCRKGNLLLGPSLGSPRNAQVEECVTRTSVEYLYKTTAIGIFLKGATTCFASLEKCIPLELF